MCSYCVMTNITVYNQLLEKQMKRVVSESSLSSVFSNSLMKLASENHLWYVFWKPTAGLFILTTIVNTHLDHLTKIQTFPILPCIMKKNWFPMTEKISGFFKYLFVIDRSVYIVSVDIYIIGTYQCKFLKSIIFFRFFRVPSQQNTENYQR